MCSRYIVLSSYGPIDYFIQVQFVTPHTTQYPIVTIHGFPQLQWGQPISYKVVGKSAPT